MVIEASVWQLTEINNRMAKAMNDKVILLHVVSGPMDYFTTEHFLKIEKNGSVDPEPIQPHPAGKKKKAAQYFLIFGK